MRDTYFIREALRILNNYINDGSLLPEDPNDPYYAASEAFDLIETTVTEFLGGE